MIEPPSQEPPRIAKINSSAQQFRELINSLRNNQIRDRQQQQTQLNRTELSPNNDNPTQISPPSTDKEKQLNQNNIFDTVEKDELTLKVVPKTEIGGRDELKKHKVAFDSRPQQQKIKVVESRREAGVQFEQSKSKQTSFSFESPRKSVSIQCQKEKMNFTTPNQSTFLMHASKNNQKAGQIVRQQLKNDLPAQSQPAPTKLIRDINESLVINYCRKQKLVEKSQPSEIFNFFTNLCLTCDVIIRSPSIKKFKNCIYYGYAIARDESYEGFLYFYDNRIYYGQFLNGVKHGLGVELAYNDQIKYKGEFVDGRKSGKFNVQKPNQKYIGYLQNGLYQGQGRLTTPDYIYQGLFEQGEKNGYGQEFYPKTGVKISGMFKNGVLAKTRATRSIAELREKSKQREKERLQQVRKRSLEKHSVRMNRVRNSFRESEYEIDFQPQTDYNQLPLIHYNPSKLDVYRQPIQKLPNITRQKHLSPQPITKIEPISARSPHMDFRKRGRQRSSKILEVNPQRMSSSENEQPLPTPCLSYPRREQ